MTMREQLPEHYKTSDDGQLVDFGELLKLKPQPGRIIVLLDNFKYTGKLVIPESAKRKPTIGTVIAVGEGITSVKPHDVVVFGLYSGTALKFAEIPVVRVLSPDEILCTKEGTAELVDLEA